METPDIQQILRELVGHRCEMIDNPIGSVLLIDIGPVGLPDPLEQELRPISWRHLTIECPWRLETSETVLCDWNDTNGADGAISNAVASLIGQRIVRVVSNGPGWDLILAWEGGVSLITLADRTEDRSDAWSILGTDGLEVGVGPKRSTADGVEIFWRPRS